MTFGFANAVRGDLYNGFATSSGAFGLGPSVGIILGLCFAKPTSQTEIALYQKTTLIAGDFCNTFTVYLSDLDDQKATRKFFKIGFE